MLPEQSIVGARASVMIYDETYKKWIPSGNSSGLSKVQIFHHMQNNTFRVVGRKLQDHEVVINCSILKGLKYNQATATFHQWRDAKYIYGLNFSSQQDAENFARAMMHTLEVLSGRALPQLTPTGNNQQPNISYDEDMGYRTMTREDADMMNHQTIISPQTPTPQQGPPQQQHPGHHRASSASSPPQMQQQQQQNIPPHQQQMMMQQQQQQQQQIQHPIYASNIATMNQQTSQNGNQQIYVPSSMSVLNSLNSIATSSIKPNPPPLAGLQMPPQAVNNYAALGTPPIIQQQQQQPQIQAAPIPPPPPAFQNSAPPPAPAMPPMNAMNPMSVSGGAPPPAPPPPPPTSGPAGMDMGSLASQLQQAKLRKTSQPSADNGTSNGNANNGGAGNYGTVGRSTTGEMASMLDEMAKTLARRREKQKTQGGDGDIDAMKKSNTLPHKISNSNSQTISGGNSSSLADSPKSRKRFGSASEEQILKQVNGSEFSLPSSASFDVESFKAEIIKEIRSEIAKAKKEIIDAIKVEFNRR
jgi:enabled